MAHFKDLSPYTYTASPYARPTLGAGLNIGWLSSSEPYVKGDVQAAILVTIRRLAQHPVNLYRGSHTCGFCLTPVGIGYGNGEIHVPDPQNHVTYIAPVMIEHYIDAHQYQPPQVFLDAAAKLR